MRLPILARRYHRPPMAGLALPPTRTPRTAAFVVVVGVVLAVAAAVAAPSSVLLPGPRGGAATAAAAAVLVAAFVAGFAAPVGGFFAVLALTVIEGAIRKWLYNSVTVFLVKDFLLVGVYAA